jgi:hypothetical protein
MANQILAIALCSLACAASPAHAGWFGPSTFEECVLDMMKGQQSSMMNTVMRVCDTKFPCTTDKILGRREIRDWSNQTCIDAEVYDRAESKRLGMPYPDYLQDRPQYHR